MDSRYLKSLIAVVERGSIADAARAEGLTAAAISQRIQALEREFGFALLTRGGHAARPSEACLNILPRARHIVHETTLLAADIDPQGLSGTLKIGAISTALTGMLPAVLRWLTANAPNIRPTIAPGSSRSLYQAILDQELDAAILVAPPFDLPDTLHGVSLRKEELLLMSRYAPDKSIADMLLQHPYIRYDPETWGGHHPQAFLD
ncbi:MAG: LysR family transcriptional regulator, partial [Burkholderiales bacterium]|nr:LysR family transcriptional regulator [Burkholderiales bacterium]